MAVGRTRLDAFDNRWYSPGRPLPVVAIWLIVNRVFFQTRVPWPSLLKVRLLRAFGA
jgi:hypothetical protein